MLSNFWRFLVALFDVRGWARLLTGRPQVDVVFITNLRDEAERERFFGRWVPPLGHANGPRIYLNGVAGRVRGIYVTAEEMMSKEGRRLAQAQFIAACEWAESKGAKVVLLAASTKRLFGRDGALLKERFPNLLFTIGDNGTSHMLWSDVERAFAAAGLSSKAGPALPASASLYRRFRQDADLVEQSPAASRVMVIGPYGILGSYMTRQLLQAGYEVVGYGANETALQQLAAQHGIAVSSQIDAIGQVDAVVACTHSAAAKLTPHCVAKLRRPGRKLLVVDVAEPANLDQAAYSLCQPVVVRQDAGNAYARGLHYVLGPMSWRLLMLSRGVVFGCFAEAMTLFHAIHGLGQRQLLQRDWFVVDEAQIAQVAAAFHSSGFTPAPPRCFGAKVSRFELSLHEATVAATSERFEPLPAGLRPTV